jgi:enamine deaminase RidA (YjgF/YER057c/UK114 family)
VSKKTIINPASLPRPRGFSHAIRTSASSDFLFLAGQDASGTDGEIVGPGNMVVQFEQVLRNLHTVIDEAGGSLTDVTKLNIYITDRSKYLANLKELGGVFRSHFGGYYPAIALVEVVGLFKSEALIEVEGFAILGD